MRDSRASPTPGSAPGIANVLTREAVDLLESCSRIDIFVYDGIWSNKFIPFWWSPETAFGDMAAEPVVYKDGEFIRVKPFNNPEMTEFRGLGLRRMVDHEHEEPVTMGLLADRGSQRGQRGQLPLRWSRSRIGRGFLQDGTPLGKNLLTSREQRSYQWT